MFIQSQKKILFVPIPVGPGVLLLEDVNDPPPPIQALQLQFGTVAPIEQDAQKGERRSSLLPSDAVRDHEPEQSLSRDVDGDCEVDDDEAIGCC